MASVSRLAIFLQVKESGRRKCYGPIEQPVAGSSHGQRLGADLEGEDLAGDDPGAGTPRAGEEEDVDADEGDEGPLARKIGGVGTCAHAGNDELASGHANSAEEEQVAATPLLDEVETWEGGSDVDAGGDEADDEGVLEAGVLEELWAVVEDEAEEWFSTLS